MNVLLIDDNIVNNEKIINGLNTNTKYILFNYNTDTLESIKTKINELNITNINSCGIIAHNKYLNYFKLVDSMNECYLNDILSWSEMKHFINFLKDTFSLLNFDFLACAIYSNPNWKNIIDTLQLELNININASTDNTGSSLLGGNWFLESHSGVNLKNVYFTDLIDEFHGLLYNEPFSNTNYQIKSMSAGRAIVWGDSYKSAHQNLNSNTDLQSGIIAIYTTGDSTWSALKTNGTVLLIRQYETINLVTDDSGQTLTDVISIYSNKWAFAALTSTGKVVTYADTIYGGDSKLWGDGTISLSSSLQSGVVDICPGPGSFAAIKNDGTVVTWGHENYAANSSSVSESLVNVVSIVSNQGVYYSAFAALKSNGSVVAWGRADVGGNTSITIGSGHLAGNTLQSQINSGVVALYYTNYAFAALKNNGDLIWWRSSDSSGSYSNIVHVLNGLGGFGAIKIDGSVTFWNASNDSSRTDILSNVVAIYSTGDAVSALKRDGSLVVWGNSSNNAGNARNYINNQWVSVDISSNIVGISATFRDFAALKTGGSVVSWGYYAGDSSSLSSELSSGIAAVYSGGGEEFGTFAALKTNGSLVAWGRSNIGGIIPTAILSDLTSGIIMVYSSPSSFIVIKTTETSFNLNPSYYSNMDRYNILCKKDNRRRTNLTTLNNNVFTLSTSYDLSKINLNIPSGKTLRIIVPDYNATASFSSTASIPDTTGNFIIACEECEPVLISGTRYINYGGFVYNDSTSNFTKLTTATINSRDYTLYGGANYSSGIIFIKTPPLPTFGTWTISYKNLLAGSFTITPPTSNSDGALTYSSSNTSIATVSETTINLISSGLVTITATQASTNDFNTGTKTTNLLILGGSNNFTSVDFTGVDLSSSNLTDGNLTNANLSGATITNVDFTNVNITGANITGLTFTNKQKLQLLKNSNNRTNSYVSVNALTASDIINATPTFTSDLSKHPSLIYTVITPSAGNVISIENTISQCIIPTATNETFTINGIIYYNNGTNIIKQSDSSIVENLIINNKNFQLYIIPKT